MSITIFDMTDLELLAQAVKESKEKPKQQFSQQAAEPRLPTTPPKIPAAQENRHKETQEFTITFLTTAFGFSIKIAAIIIAGIMGLIITAAISCAVWIAAIRLHE